MKAIEFETRISLDNVQNIKFNNLGILFNHLLKKEMFPLFFNNEINLKVLRLFFEDKDEYYSLFDPLVQKNPKKQPDSKMIVYFQGAKFSNFNSFTEKDFKNCIIDGWEKFFNEIPNHFFCVDIAEIINKLRRYRNVNWDIMNEIKQIKYGNLQFIVYQHINYEKMELYIFHNERKIVLFSEKTEEIRETFKFHSINIKNKVFLIIKPKWNLDEITLDLTKFL